MFLAHLSQRLKICYCDHSLSTVGMVVVRPSTISLNNISSYTTRRCTMYGKKLVYIKQHVSFFFFSVMQFEQCPKNGSRKRFFLLIALLCAALLLYLCFYGVTTPFAAPPAIKMPSVNKWLQPAQTWIPYSYKNFRDKVHII